MCRRGWALPRQLKPITRDLDYGLCTTFGKWKAHKLMSVFLLGFCGVSALNELFLAFTPLMEGYSHTALILQTARPSPTAETQLNLFNLSKNIKGEIQHPLKKCQSLMVAAVAFNICFRISLRFPLKTNIDLIYYTFNIFHCFRFF